jgi:hypothetical protein
LVIVDACGCDRPQSTLDKQSTFTFHNPRSQSTI